MSESKEMPLTVCVDCCRPYEGRGHTCPYCGHCREYGSSKPKYVELCTGQRCYLCGVMLYRRFVMKKVAHIRRVMFDDCHTRDHVIAKSKGGKKTKPCCNKCNTEKGDK